MRDDPEFIVAACTSCNTFANRTVYDVVGKTREQLVEQKWPVVLARREECQRFWEEHIGSKPPSGSGEVIIS